MDGDSFARTYREVSRGIFAKLGVVWARQANEAGSITTREGSTDYERGDWLVFNDRHGRDGYAISNRRFSQLYEAAQD